MWAHVTLVVLCGLIFAVRAGRLVLRGTGRAAAVPPASGCPRAPGTPDGTTGPVEVGH